MENEGLENLKQAIQSLTLNEANTLNLENELYSQLSASGVIGLV